MPSPSKPMPLARIKSLLAYDPRTGIVTWRVPMGTSAAGDPAGWKNPEGYWMVQIAGCRYKRSRIAWALHHGDQPPAILDHRNLIRHEDHIENLRPASNSQNQVNRALKPKASGLPRNIRRSRAKVVSYVAVFEWQGKRVRVGTYSTIAQADAALLTRMPPERQAFLPKS